jgi:hypothetical protein
MALSAFTSGMTNLLASNIASVFLLPPHMRLFCIQNTTEKSLHIWTVLYILDKIILIKTINDKPSTQLFSEIITFMKYFL